MFSLRTKGLDISAYSDQGETLHAIILTDPKVSAHQLYAIKPDVVIVSFEFVEHAYRRIRNFTEDMSKGRPNSPLHSDFWNLTDWPIKRLFIDEAQRLGNTRSATFTAVKAIPARATALFSGTFPHMKWDAWAGPVSFLKHQPFTSLDSFNRVFATFRSDGYIAEEPEASRMALLQRFLLRFTIARPASVLELKGTDQYKGTFSLRSSDLAESEFHFDKYIQAQLKEEKENKSKAKKRSEQSITKDLDSKPEKQDSPRVLVHATRAQLSSMHYLLMDKRFMAQKESRPRWELDDGDGSDDDEYQDSDAEYLDPDAEYLPGDTSQHSDNSDDDESSDNDESSGNDEDEGKLQTGRKATENDLNPIHETVLEDKSEADLSSRKGWLKYIEDHPDEVLKSGRIREVLGLYRQLCEKYPDRKICICSQYLKFLDLVRVAMLHKFSVEGLEYNGVLRDGIRQANLAKFKSTADCSIPLLLSGKAGGKGINIPEASIMIQTEVWWNRNAELQLYSRMLRPGQKHEVIIIRVEGKDCSIESYIIGVQLRKKTTNTLSMHPLVRPHDQAPEIPPMLYHLPSGPTFSPSPSRDSTTSS
jgi:SNF2 family DNA or RNA helicase